MKRNYLISGLSILAGLLLVEPAFALGLRITPTDSRPIESRPRQIVSVGFRVVNETSESIDLVPEIELPVGWRTVIKDGPFTLEPTESDIRFISVLIPADAPAGGHPIRFRLRGVAPSILESTSEATVLVLADYRLHLVLDRTPTYILAGEAFDALFSLTNFSNARSLVRLELVATDGLSGKLPFGQLELAVGETREISVPIGSSVVTRAIESHVQLAAILTSDENVRSVAGRSIEILPSGKESTDWYHRIPSNIVVTMVGERVGDQNNTSFQIGLGGSGVWNAKTGSRVAYKFRGPDQRFKTAHGKDQTFRIGYTAPSLSFGLGDQQFTLSSLLTRAEGRGAEISTVYEGVSLRTFAATAPVGRTQNDRLGLSIQYPFNQDKGHLNVNALIQDRVTTNHLFSIGGIMKSWGNRLIDMELATDSKGHPAARLSLVPNEGSYYSFQFEIAGPNFPGVITDTASVGFNYLDSFSETMRYRIGATYRQQNLSRQPELDSATEVYNVLLGVSRDTTFGLGMTADTQFNQETDRLSPSDTRNDLMSVRLGTSFRRKHWHLAGFHQAGVKSVRSTGEAFNRNRSVATLSYYPSDRVLLHSSLTRIEDEELIEQGEDLKLESAHHAEFYLANKLKFSIDLQTEMSKRTRSGNTEFGAAISKSMRLGLMGLKFRYKTFQNSQQKAEQSVLMTYRVPFGLPVRKRRDVGEVQGVVFDSVADRPASGTILRLGDALAIADANGHFLFPDMKVGAKVLSYRPSTIAAGRVFEEVLPLDLVVPAGKTKDIKLNLVSSATLKGNVSLYKFIGTMSPVRGSDKVVQANSRTLSSVAGVPGVLFLAKRGAEARQWFTDSRGGFEYFDFRPGIWKIKVIANRLPPYHYLERDEFVVDLSPDEEAVIEIRVLPKIRPLIFSQEEEGVVEEVVE